MNREVLINIIDRGGIRFIPVRRCFLCNEYVGYKFVRMCDGSMIPVFSSGCRCCGINNGTLSERTWDAVNYCSGISITTLCHISRKVNIILQANI